MSSATTVSEPVAISPDAATGSDGKPPRLVSLDVYRGFIMLILAGGGFGIVRAAAAHPDSSVWQFFRYQFSHVGWRGCAFWDLIQPAFMFMVGVAVPYSYASRKARGDSDAKILMHAARRSLVLVLLGIFIVSLAWSETHWRFTNVLTQIGLGYMGVVLLRGRGFRVQLASLLAILVGTWLTFVLYPAGESAFASHWTLRDNAAHAFDQWFLNLFPRAEPFVAHEGGYQTLNFIPSIGTMILGLMAGELLRSGLDAREKLRRILMASAVCFGLGIAADPSILPFVQIDWTLCPIVKRLWTPSWVLFSGGWTFAFLAAFYWTIDMRGWRSWTFPFVVVGMNSIAIYMMAQTMTGSVRSQLRTHFGIEHPIAAALGVLLVFWCVCWWMYRRKIFLRI